MLRPNVLLFLLMRQWEKEKFSSDLNNIKLEQIDVNRFQEWLWVNVLGV